MSDIMFTPTSGLRAQRLRTVFALVTDVEVVKDGSGLAPDLNTPAVKVWNT